MGLKRPSSKVGSKVTKKPAAKVTKVTKFKKPAAQTGKKGILKKQQKEIEKDNGEEGEEEEIFTEDEVVHTVTAKNLKTHQQLLDAKLCSAKEIDKALAKLPANEVQGLWKKFERIGRWLELTAPTRRPPRELEARTGSTSCSGPSSLMEGPLPRTTRRPCWSMRRLMRREAW